RNNKVLPAPAPLGTAKSRVLPVFSRSGGKLAVSSTSGNIEFGMPKASGSCASQARRRMSNSIVRSVGHIGRVALSAGELPQQKTVDRAEGDFRLLGPGGAVRASH